MDECPDPGALRGWARPRLLRDLVRAVSRRERAPPRRVGVADERGRSAALFDGRPQLDVGPRTDVLEGCPKAVALMLLLRGMNPQVLAVDEITAPEDVAGPGVRGGLRSGRCWPPPTGRDAEDLEQRPLYRELMEAGVFRRLVLIRREAGPAVGMNVEELP
ncbi:MAG: hypothetical protein ACLUJG_08305 [Lawsonibacter sp.]